MITQFVFSQTIDSGASEFLIEREVGAEDLIITSSAFRLTVPMPALGTFMSALAKVTHGSKQDAAIGIDSENVITIGRSGDGGMIWIGQEPFYLRLPYDAANQLLAAVSMANKQWVSERVRTIAAARQQLEGAPTC